VSRGGKAEELIGERVFKDKPPLAAVILATNSNFSTQAKALAGNPVPGLAERGGRSGHNLPPQLQAQEINGSMRQDPPKQAGLDIHFAQTAHSRPPPFFDALFKIAAHQEHVSFRTWECRRFQFLNADRETQLGLADEGNFTMHFLENLVHIPLLDLSLDIE